ncbi:WD40-repeat-containing domain [Phytophthora cactorum]|nr:WD40-repeat-containing domain [Phytophthora cactorum]
MDIMMRLKGAGFSTIANAFREREKRLGGGLPLLDFVDIVYRVYLGLRQRRGKLLLPVPNSAPHGATSTSTTPNPLSTWIEKLKWSADFPQRMFTILRVFGAVVGLRNDFIVNIWKIVDAETKILWRRLSVHSDLVMDALEIPVHDLLVTCDLRHTIQLWDITDGRNRGALMAHERGVRQLCYGTSRSFA